MANQNLNIKIQLRNDTSINWNAINPVLLKGEIGIEIDTSKFKVGNGVSVWSDLGYASAQSAKTFTRAPLVTDNDYDIGTMWINTASSKAYILYDVSSGNALWKQIISPDDLAALGGGDMLSSQFATNAKAELGYVDSAIIADKLTSARSITISGDVESAPIAFDGTANIVLPALLQNVITAGSGAKVTVNSKGLVTEIATLMEADIPNISYTKVTGLGTAATRDVGNTSGNVVLVESDGKINESLLPPLSIVDVFTVSSTTEMLALNAQHGDLCIVASATSQLYILVQTPANILSNWLELQLPINAVITINGKTGESITLTSSDISEGTNLYYTEDRATTNFNFNFPNKSSAELSDGATILHSTDTLILNGGTSNGW